MSSNQKQFLYRYYEQSESPFLSITELPIEQAREMLIALQKAGKFGNPNIEGFLKKRYDRDAMLRDVFIRHGGKPDFSDARGWRKDQNAKDLVMALTVEAAELAEIFMWLHSDEADSVKDNADEYVHLQEELSDVFWYLCRLCEHFEVDLAKAVEDKTMKNAAKYPVKEEGENELH